MIIGPGWKPPVYTDADLGRLERERYLTTSELLAVVGRAVSRLTPEAKATLRQKMRDAHLLNMPCRNTVH